MCLLFRTFVNLNINYMSKTRIQIEQLDEKMRLMSNWSSVAMPPIGWAKAIRTALGMTLQQVANRLGVSKIAVHNLEKREAEKSITLLSLHSLADALDMQLVYGLIPKDDSLEKLIDRKALELAKRIVERTSTSMGLEDQENTAERLEKAIHSRKEQLKSDLPKTLWD